MSNKLNQIVENWSELLDAGTPIKNQRVKKATALMLQNEMNYLSGKAINETSSWAGGSMDPQAGGYAQNGEFHKIAIPMVRRTFPELLAHEVVGVQPMTGPVGLAFAMRFIADQEYDGVSGTEIGHNTIDSAYTGSHALSAGEGLGSDTDSTLATAPTIGKGLGIGSGAAIKELSMTIEKSQVDAKTRKLRSRWSLEVAQDIKAMHGLDLEEEMMDALAYEITAEIDRELVTKIDTVAATNARSGNWDYSTADGRWEMEKNRNLYNRIIRNANGIAVDTRRGAGNYVIASPTVCSALETLDQFIVAPVEGDVDTAQTGVARIGSLGGRINVYRDTFNVGDSCVVGYKGVSPYDTGIVYLPYIQLMTMRAQFEDSFNPSVGLMSRYAIHDQIFGSKYYYVKINCQNMDYTTTTSDSTSA